MKFSIINSIKTGSSLFAIFAAPSELAASATAGSDRKTPAARAPARRAASDGALRHSLKGPGEDSPAGRMRDQHPCSRGDDCAGCSFDTRGNSVAGIIDCEYDTREGSCFRKDGVAPCHGFRTCGQGDDCAFCFFDGNGNLVTGSIDCQYNGVECVRKDGKSHCQIARPVYPDPGCSQGDDCAGCSFDGNGNSVTGITDCLYHEFFGCFRKDGLGICQLPRSTPTTAPVSKAPTAPVSKAPTVSTECSGDNCVIAGGLDNQANGDDSVVSGGQGNVAQEPGAVVSGGSHNAANGYFSVVSGGVHNTAEGSAVVGGGEDNTASGYGSVVPGGVYNRAFGGSSIAMGSSAEAKHHMSFVVNLVPGNAASTKDSQFLVHTGEFVIRIDGQEAIIDSNTIKRLIDLLNAEVEDQKEDHPLDTIDDPQGAIKDLQEQLEEQRLFNEDQKEQLDVQQEKLDVQQKKLDEQHLLNEYLQEQFNELKRTMNVLAARL